MLRSERTVKANLKGTLQALQRHIDGVEVVSESESISLQAAAVTLLWVLGMEDAVTQAIDSQIQFNAELKDMGVTSDDDEH